MTADSRHSLEYARNVWRGQLQDNPDGPYADHYRRALADVERRIATLKTPKRGGQTYDR
jgi:hypothetical protein